MKTVEEIKQLYKDLVDEISKHKEEKEVTIISIARIGDDSMTLVGGNGDDIGVSVIAAIQKLPLEVNIALLGGIIAGCNNHPEMKEKMPSILADLGKMISEG